MIDDLIEFIEDFLEKTDSQWKDKPDHEGEMRCEIKWENGLWSILVGDGCNDGTSMEYASLDREQFYQALSKYVTELKRWIKNRPKYGHSVEKEKKVLEVCLLTLKNS